VEAVRVGTVIAHSRDAYSQWRSATGESTGGRGLAGAELEATIMALAASHPDLVDVRAA
jgi:hypothetical protein